MKPENMLLTGAVLAGVSVATEASAASMTVESAFVVSFESTTSAGENYTFDPFSGPAGALTGVTMSLDSRIVTGTPFANTTFVVSFPEGMSSTVIGTEFLLSSAVSETFAFERDLFALGLEASDFVGGPVEFRSFIDVEEAASSGVWFAGEDPSGGGGGGGITVPGDFGSVSLTYFYDDVPEVPLPGSLFLLGGAVGALAATRKRRTKR